MVIDHDAYVWHDAQWAGLRMHGQVLYELHIGAFTPEGSFDAAISQLDALVELGVTCLEVMPVSETPGRFNWGYDGVCLFAPTRNYGDPEGFKRFVDAAHRRGLGVILDVVYNHLGPDGCYLRCFSESYFSEKHSTEWGEALNFDGPGSEGVRDFFRENAAYWISEFHLDGLRFDATQNIYDDSASHILSEISDAARRAAASRDIILIGENEPQDVRCIAPTTKGGFGLDAVWSDDFHHSARVALTGFHEAYYEDYRGRPQELISAAKRCFLYQGQYYAWQKKNRGTAVLDSHPSEAFVFYLQNHDQVANAAPGLRICDLTPRERYKALTAFMLLLPQTPLLFMGQEYTAPQRFDFFADHHEELAAKVFTGRREFISQFPSYARPDVQRLIPDPRAETTFQGSKLRPEDRAKNAAMLAFHKDLLALRRTDPVIARQLRSAIDGAVLGLDAFVLRFYGDHGDDRLLVVNLGEAFDVSPVSEPLLAPPMGGWNLVWASQDARYDGPGMTNPMKESGWKLTAEGAWFFRVREVS
jgi:maltooligosyltrehalose trehalohydrolase